MSDDNGNDYTPIDCATYSQYELYIMHRERLRVEWRDPQGISHLETLLPKDLLTEQGAEYLIAQTLNGNHIKLRLDYIIRALVIDSNA